jgi:putative integral membrane protein (TIGR02587 family)
MTSQKSSARPVRQSLEEYARGVAGGLLFSLPLLYTMEVWWTGFVARPAALLANLLFGLILLLGYNRYTGLREDASWLEIVIDAVEEMGFGLVLAAVVLWLLGRIDVTTAPNEILGKVLVEGVIVAIGVSVGTAQLGSDGDNRDRGLGPGGHAGKQAGKKAREQMGISGELVLAACGAVLLAGNVAPTEEIVQIAVEASPWKLLGLVPLSLALALLLLFGSDFHGSRKIAHPSMPPTPRTMLVHGISHYAVALAVSAFLLWFFGRFGGTALTVCAAETVVLAVPGVLGAAAGRLLLQ